MGDNFRLLKNIFMEVEQPLFLGDGLATGEFHSLMQPGQFVSTNLKETDGSDDMQIQSSLTDDVIDTQFIYRRLNGSISQQYSDILNEEALPYAPIPASDQAEIDADNKWLANNQPSYDVFKKRYYDALRAYSQEANKQSPDPAALPELLDNLNEANKNWETMGQKSVYERKQARVIYLSSGDPALLWTEFQNLLTFHSKVAPHRGPYKQTFLVPSVSEWNSPGTSWARFTKTINESDSYNYSSQTSWGGSGGFGWGLFSIGAGASGSSSYTYSQSDVTTVSIALDYMRVRIDRDWLKSDIFGYRFWWWKKAFGYKLLSDGGNLSVTPPQRPIGILPFLPNYLIVVRNLSITSNFTHNDATLIQSQLSASASFGWGPFSCSGNYSEANSTQTTHASFDGTTIKVDQPQIIAFTGTLMPLTPNPDRTLPWQDDHAPFDPPAAAVKAFRDVRHQDFLEAAKLDALHQAEADAASHRLGMLKTARRAIEMKFVRPIRETDEE
jgi:hypothetical protein